MKNIALITVLTVCQALACASADLDADWEDSDQGDEAAEFGTLEQAQQAQGQDAPGKSCIRNNRDGSSTSGKCESVCKDRPLYEPHPSEDPAGTYATCTEAARVRPGAFADAFVAPSTQVVFAVQ